ncbi:MAG: polysaccharide biosynthesis tyrosine autokinase [Deltaproteobacteria bacterium]|nr:polysaccharide biosynthesis tyrosine autokinase [Deltaproteobacteria bacterium]
MNEKNKQEYGYAINPVYSQTRKESIDLEALRKHRIVSLTDGDVISDQLKILDTQVINILQEKKGNSIIITSPGKGDGKTLTSINLAISLSQKIDKTVLLVDADLRNPSIHKYLGIERVKGLADYLLGTADIPELMINPGITKLVLLPGGMPVNNSTVLLGSPKMRMLVDEMKERYPERVIIFDTPSLLDSADALVFSSLVDGILLVVEAEKTTRRDIEKAISLMSDKPLIGTVYNKAM